MTLMPLTDKKSKRHETDDFSSQPIYIVIPLMRSLHNVGSIFRIADGMGATKIFLCGWTGTPPAPNLIKVSLGAENAVPWEYKKQAWRVIRELKKQGVLIIGLELTDQSFDFRDFIPTQPIALVVGNECTGLSKTLLRRCDSVIHLPMMGVKGSLNVSVAVGIALYHLRFGSAVDKK